MHRVLARANSQLVFCQVMKDCGCSDDKMTPYCQEVRKLEEKFDGRELAHVGHDDSTEVDSLTRLRSRRKSIPPGVFLEILRKSSIDKSKTSAKQILVITHDWRTPLLEYIKNDTLPPERAEAEKIARKSKTYYHSRRTLSQRGNRNTYALHITARRKRASK